MYSDRCTRRGINDVYVATHCKVLTLPVTVLLVQTVALICSILFPILHRVGITVTFLSWVEGPQCCRWLHLFLYWFNNQLRFILFIFFCSIILSKRFSKRQLTFLTMARYFPSRGSRTQPATVKLLCALANGPIAFYLAVYSGIDKLTNARKLSFVLHWSRIDVTVFG